MKPKQLDEARRYLAEAENDPGQLQEVTGACDSNYAEVLVALLEGDHKRTKNRAAKLIAILSRASPHAVEPHWDRLLEHVTGSDTILRWNALIAMGNLAHLATGRQIERLLPQVSRLLRDDSMVTAGHAITCLSQAALARGEHREQILTQLLAIDHSARAPGCAQILDGKVLKILEPFIHSAGRAERAHLAEFATGQEASPRSGTRKLATRLQKRLARTGG